MTDYKFPGTMSLTPRDYEDAHRAVSRQAAAEGMVLLKNEQILPLAPGARVALYGMGAVSTVKGGTGSGDVNQRQLVTVEEGMEQAGYEIANRPWLDDCRAALDQALAQRQKTVWEKMDQGEYFVIAYFETPIRYPESPEITKVDCDAAFYILPRNAGEGLDRADEPGDYRLSPSEIRDLTRLCELYEKVVLVLNTGGIVDLGILDDLPGIGGVLCISQPGMEAGNAFADIVSGRVSPSGHLSDTWPLHPEDCPALREENRKGVKEGEVPYLEDIYVGYRYYDTFGIPVRFGFGDGLSYTEFSEALVSLTSAGRKVRLSVRVTNTGSRPGRHVVQVYATCPWGSLPKEYRRLVGFGKTEVLAPGAYQDLTIDMEPEDLASFRSGDNRFVLESGLYGLWIGSSLKTARLAAGLRLTESSWAVSPAPEPAFFDFPEDPQGPARRQAMETAILEEHLPVLALSPEPLQRPAVPAVNSAVQDLSQEEQLRLCIGSWESGNSDGVGAAAVHVPGAAGETFAPEGRDIRPLILADGPAGLRLAWKYYVKDGHPVLAPAEECMEKGVFARSAEAPEGVVYYQFCTAFPVGTCLAQTWDRDLVASVGRAVAEEMEEFSVDLWLAPGMNIHRDPLCGRNFEYFSEDPCLTGFIAAAMTRGVQSMPGRGVTVKHFACNSQETVRIESDSHISSRALREIYLKGFEIAVREAQPKALMTSYNLVNGVHAANSRWLCTQVLREDWGFQGLVMTDWLTTRLSRRCCAHGCIHAGNDLIMPGSPEDAEDLRQALASGAITPEELSRCAGHILDFGF